MTPAFAESGKGPPAGADCTDSILNDYLDKKGCSAFIAPEPTLTAPSAAAPAPQSPPGARFDLRKYCPTCKSQEEFENRERRCLATAIYFEARSRPVRGQIGLGQVILNRVRSPQFPNTICEVVYQGQMEKDCQFVFACDGRSLTPKEDDEWALAQAIARKITAGELWLPELGYSTSLKDALAIGVPPEREEDAHIAVRPPQSPPGPEPSNGEMVVATGTGFIINDRGDLVTDNHVVDDVHGLVLG